MNILATGLSSYEEEGLEKSREWLEDTGSRIRFSLDSISSPLDAMVRNIDGKISGDVSTCSCWQAPAVPHNAFLGGKMLECCLKFTSWWNRHESGKIKYAPSYLYIYIRVIMASVDTCCTQHVGFLCLQNLNFLQVMIACASGPGKRRTSPPRRNQRRRRPIWKYLNFRATDVQRLEDVGRCWKMLEDISMYHDNQMIIHDIKTTRPATKVGHTTDHPLWPRMYCHHGTLQRFVCHCTRMRKRRKKKRRKRRSPPSQTGDLPCNLTVFLYGTPPFL